jgi:hypothetical protein
LHSFNYGINKLTTSLKGKASLQSLVAQKIHVSPESPFNDDISAFTDVPRHSTPRRKPIPAEVSSITTPGDESPVVQSRTRSKRQKLLHPMLPPAVPATSRLNVTKDKVPARSAAMSVKGIVGKGKVKGKTKPQSEAVPPSEYARQLVESFDYVKCDTSRSLSGCNILFVVVEAKASDSTKRRMNLVSLSSQLYFLHSGHSSAFWSLYRFLKPEPPLLRYSIPLLLHISSATVSVRPACSKNLV